MTEFAIAVAVLVAGGVIVLGGGTFLARGGG